MWLGYSGGFKMNFSALWNFWAVLSDFKIHMKCEVLTHFTANYSMLIFLANKIRRKNQISSKKTNNRYFEIISAAGDFLWTFWSKNSWIFENMQYWVTWDQKQEVKVHIKCELFGQFPENSWKKSKSSSWNPPPCTVVYQLYFLICVV